MRKGVPSQLPRRDTVQPPNDYILLVQLVLPLHRKGNTYCIVGVSDSSVPPRSNYLRAFLSWTHQRTHKGFSPFHRLLIQLLSLVREQKSRFVTKGGTVCLQSSQKRATFEASVSLCPWQKIVDKFNLRNEFLLITVI